MRINEKPEDTELYSLAPTQQNVQSGAVNPIGSNSITGDEAIDGYLLSLPEEKRQAELDKINAPLTGEDLVLIQQSDPYRRFTSDEFAKIDEYRQTQESHIFSEIGEGAGQIATDFLKAIQASADHPLKATAQALPSLVEGFVQNGVGMYGMLAKSTNPDSPLFKFKSLINREGSLEERTKQFNAALDWHANQMAVYEGKDTYVINKDYIDPDITKAMSYIADPTFWIPFGGIAMKGASLVGFGEAATKAGLRATAIKNAVIGGTIKWGLGAPIEVLGGATRNTIEYGMQKSAGAFEAISGIESGEIVRTMRVAGVGTAASSIAGVTVPYATGISQAYVGGGLAAGLGEALSMTGERMIRSGGQRGVLSFAAQAIKDTEKAGLVLSSQTKTMLNIINTVDPLLAYGDAMATGAIYGSVVGGGLAYLSEGRTGIGHGIGAGIALGGVAGGLGKTISDVSGNTRLLRESVQTEFVMNSLKEINATKHAELSKLRDDPRAEKIREVINKIIVADDSLMDKTDWHVLDNNDFNGYLETWLDEVGITREQLKSNDVYKLAANLAINDFMNAEGYAIKSEANGRTKIIINKDNMLNGSGATNTLPHEFLHAMMVNSALGPEFRGRFKDALLGTFSKDGKRLTEGQVSKQETVQMFKKYAELWGMSRGFEDSATKRKVLDDALTAFEKDGTLVEFASDDAGLAGRKVLDHYAEEFAAYYFTHWFKSKPMEFFISGGEMTGIKGLLDRVSDSWADYWEGRIKQTDARFDFLKQAEIDDGYFKNGTRVRVSSLDYLLKDFVSATSQLKNRGYINLDLLSKDTVKSMIASEGLDDVVFLDKTGQARVSTKAEAKAIKKQKGTTAHAIIERISPNKLTDADGVYRGPLNEEELTAIAGAGLISEANANKIRTIQNTLSNPDAPNVFEFGYIGETEELGVGPNPPRARGNQVRFKNRKALIVSLDSEIGKNGEFNFRIKTLDMQVIDGREAKLWLNPEVRKYWGDNRTAFKSDFFRYLSNVSLPAEEKIPSQFLWSDGNGAARRDIMHQMAGFAKSDSESYINLPIAQVPRGMTSTVTDFSVGRMMNLRTHSDVKINYVHNNAFYDIARNFKPAGLRAEETKFGKLYTSALGYRYLNKDNKFETFDSAGGHIGTAIDINTALTLAESHFNKAISEQGSKVARTYSEQRKMFKYLSEEDRQKSKGRLSAQEEFINEKLNYYRASETQRTEVLKRLASSIDKRILTKNEQTGLGFTPDELSFLDKETKGSNERSNLNKFNKQKLLDKVVFHKYISDLIKGSERGGISIIANHGSKGAKSLTSREFNTLPAKTDSIYFNAETVNTRENGYSFSEVANIGQVRSAINMQKPYFDFYNKESLKAMHGNALSDFNKMIEMHHQQTEQGAYANGHDGVVHVDTSANLPNLESAFTFAVPREYAQMNVRAIENILPNNPKFSAGNFKWISRDNFVKEKLQLWHLDTNALYDHLISELKKNELSTGFSSETVIDNFFTERERFIRSLEEREEFQIGTREEFIAKNIERLANREQISIEGGFAISKAQHLTNLKSHIEDMADHWIGGEVVVAGPTRKSRHDENLLLYRDYYDGNILVYATRIIDSSIEAEMQTVRGFVAKDTNPLIQRAIDESNGLFNHIFNDVASREQFQKELKESSHGIFELKLIERESLFSADARVAPEVKPRWTIVLSNAANEIVRITKENTTLDLADNSTRFTWERDIASKTDEQKQEILRKFAEIQQNNPTLFQEMAVITESFGPDKDGMPLKNSLHKFYAEGYQYSDKLSNDLDRKLNGQELDYDDAKRVIERNKENEISNWFRGATRRLAMDGSIRKDNWEYLTMNEFLYTRELITNYKSIISGLADEVKNGATKEQFSDSLMSIVNSAHDMIPVTTETAKSLKNAITSAIDKEYNELGTKNTFRSGVDEALDIIFKNNPNGITAPNLLKELEKIGSSIKIADESRIIGLNDFIKNTLLNRPKQENGKPAKIDEKEIRDFVEANRLSITSTRDAPIWMRNSHYDWIGSSYFVGRSRGDVTEFGTFMATVDQPRYYPAVHNMSKHTSPKGDGIVYIRFTKRVKSDGTPFWYIEEVQSNNDAAKVELIKQKIERKTELVNVLDNKDLLKVTAENIASVLSEAPEGILKYIKRLSYPLQESYTSGSDSMLALIDDAVSNDGDVGKKLISRKILESTGLMYSSLADNYQVQLKEIRKNYTYALKRSGIEGMQSSLRQIFREQYDEVKVGQINQNSDTWLAQDQSRSPEEIQRAILRSYIPDTFLEKLTSEYKKVLIKRLEEDRRTNRSPFTKLFNQRKLNDLNLKLSMDVEDANHAFVKEFIKNNIRSDSEAIDLINQEQVGENLSTHPIYSELLNQEQISRIILKTLSQRHNRNTGDSRILELAKWEIATESYISELKRFGEMIARPETVTSKDRKPLEYFITYDDFINHNDVYLSDETSAPKIISRMVTTMVRGPTGSHYDSFYGLYGNGNIDGSWDLLQNARATSRNTYKNKDFGVAGALADGEFPLLSTSRVVDYVFRNTPSTKEFLKSYSQMIVESDRSAKRTENAKKIQNLFASNPTMIDLSHSVGSNQNKTQFNDRTALFLIDYFANRPLDGDSLKEFFENHHQDVLKKGSLDAEEQRLLNVPFLPSSEHFLVALKMMINGALHSNENDVVLTNYLDGGVNSGLKPHKAMSMYDEIIPSTWKKYLKKLGIEMTRKPFEVFSESGMQDQALFLERRKLRSEVTSQLDKLVKKNRNAGEDSYDVNKRFEYAGNERSIWQDGVGTEGAGYFLDMLHGLLQPNLRNAEQGATSYPAKFGMSKDGIYLYFEQMLKEFVAGQDRDLRPDKSKFFTPEYINEYKFKQKAWFRAEYTKFVDKLKAGFELAFNVATPFNEFETSQYSQSAEAILLHKAVKLSIDEAGAIAGYLSEVPPMSFNDFVHKRGYVFSLEKTKNDEAATAQILRGHTMWKPKQNRNTGGQINVGGKEFNTEFISNILPQSELGKYRLQFLVDAGAPVSVRQYTLSIHSTSNEKLGVDSPYVSVKAVLNPDDGKASIIVENPDDSGKLTNVAKHEMLIRLQSIGSTAVDGFLPERPNRSFATVGKPIKKGGGTPISVASIANLAPKEQQQKQESWLTERTPNGKVVTSVSGLTIMLMNNKFRLYDQNKVLIGIYNSEEEARRKAVARQLKKQ
jgi:hypothetical protein